MQRMDFDKELEADTQRQIQEIRDKLEAETSRILSGQSQESQDELDALQKEYNEKHSDYAHEISHRLHLSDPSENLMSIIRMLFIVFLLQGIKFILTLLTLPG